MSQLNRGLTLLDAFSLVVGSMIGTGVFLKSATMSQMVSAPGLVLLAWIVAGILSLAGAFSYAEIGSRFPNAGGEYVYLREAYGPLPAFLFGWTRFWIASTGSVAAYGVGAATFLSGAFSLQSFGGKTTVALFFIAFYTLSNCLAVSFGGRIQAFMTSVKVLLVLALSCAILVATPIEESQLFPLDFSSPGAFSWRMFGMAVLSALWAFDGWNNLPMAAGEVKNPHRNIPLSLVAGTLVVLFLYGILNMSYFHALPLEEVLKSNSGKYPGALPVAAKAAQTFLGSSVSVIFSLFFVFSALGAMNGSILTGARVPYAMAKDGIFFRLFARVHPRSHVPVWAVFVQGLWACILAVSGTFDQLTDSVVFASWIFYGAVTFSVFLLRKRENVAPASYHAWGYPILPGIFVLAAMLLLINTVISSPKETGLGLLFIALGAPAYYAFKSKTLQIPSKLVQSS